MIKIFKSGKYGEFYNIGSNKNLNNLEITKLLLKATKKVININSNVKVKFVKDRPGHDFRYALNSNKIKKKLNWESKIEFKKGLYETFLWYYKNQNYYNSFNKRDIIGRLGLKKWLKKELF